MVTYSYQKVTLPKWYGNNIDYTLPKWYGNF